MKNKEVSLLKNDDGELYFCDESKDRNNILGSIMFAPKDDQDMITIADDINIMDLIKMRDTLNSILRYLVDDNSHNIKFIETMNINDNTTLICRMDPNRFNVTELDNLYRLSNRLKKLLSTDKVIIIPNDIDITIMNRVVKGDDSNEDIMKILKNNRDVSNPSQFGR